MRGLGDSGYHTDGYGVPRGTVAGQVRQRDIANVRDQGRAGPRVHERGGRVHWTPSP